MIFGLKVLLCKLFTSQNKAKNMIKTKHNLVFLSLIVSIISC